MTGKTITKVELHANDKNGAVFMRFKFDSGDYHDLLTGQIYEPEKPVKEVVQ